MSFISWADPASVATVVVCALALPVLTGIGLRVLQEPPASRLLLAALVVVGAGLGVGVLPIAHTTGTRAALPALACWGLTLSAAALCDARTRRMPTVLLRAATVTTAVLLIPATALDTDYSPARPLHAVIVCVLCWALLWLGWKWGSLGRADARLAALGGLGLGWLGLGALPAGVVAFCLVSGLQVGVILARGEGRRSQLPYGPALTAGFLAAALALA